ncbi:hypothetical protein C8T65DRAFT_726491 [Cerioporus squamosus]|nr:hypothetical protein C8T65DRAFT_726491 [Cerioporus squamosus]
MLVPHMGLPHTPAAFSMSHSPSKLKAWDIYAKELRDLGFGYPLWVPEPSPESGEVQLGDVGYLSQGKFCFLFNCMRGADDPVNRKGVPEGFEVFEPPDGPVEESAKTIRNHIMNPMLLCGNTRSLNVEASVSARHALAAIADQIAHVEGTMSYKVQQKAGAFLALKKPAHQTNLHCTEAIFQYLRANHAQWRDYAIQRRGRKIESQHILFVSGFVKTAVWAVGAFRHGSSSATLKIDAGAMFGGMSAGVGMSVTDCSEPMSLYRCGPVERLPWKDDVPHPNDQCIFIHYPRAYSVTGSEPPKISVLEWISQEIFRSGLAYLHYDRDEYTIAYHGNKSRPEDDYGIDEEALDYVLQHCADAPIACATSQDLYNLHQARRARNTPPRTRDGLFPGLDDMRDWNPVPMVVESTAPNLYEIDDLRRMSFAPASTTFLSHAARSNAVSPFLLLLFLLPLILLPLLFLLSSRRFVP